MIPILLKMRAALQSWVSLTEASYEEYFNRKIGKECYQSYKEGKVLVKWNRNEKSSDREKYFVVQGSNRSVASSNNKKENQDSFTSKAAQGGTQTSQSVN